MRHLREVRLTGLGIWLGRAVEEGGADVAFLQRRDAGVGVLGCRVVVRPVDQGGDAVVELVQRTGQGGDMDIVGHEHGGEAGMAMPCALAAPMPRSMSLSRSLGVKVVVKSRFTSAGVLYLVYIEPSTL